MDRLIYCWKLISEIDFHAKFNVSGALRRLDMEAIN